MVSVCHNGLISTPHNGEDDRMMHVACFDVSHELRSWYRLTYAKRVRALVRTAVPYRDTWNKLHCPERGLRMCRPVKPYCGSSWRFVRLVPWEQHTQIIKVKSAVLHKRFRGPDDRNFLIFTCRSVLEAVLATC